MKLRFKVKSLVEDHYVFGVQVNDKESGILVMEVKEFEELTKILKAGQTVYNNAVEAVTRPTVLVPVVQLEGTQDATKIMNPEDGGTGRIEVSE